MQTNVRITLLVLCTIGVLAILAGMEVFNLSAGTLEHQTALERTTREQARIRRVHSLLQEAERARLGFLLTGNENHRRRLDEIGREIRQPLEDLAAAPGNGAGRKARADRLTELASRRLAQLSTVPAGPGPANPPSAAGTSATGAAAAAAERRQTSSRLAALTDRMIASRERAVRNAARSLGVRIVSARNIVLFLLISIVVLVTVVVWLALGYLTHRGRVEMRLREATRHAEEASKAKSEFLAAMSHEVRTPLTGILGYTELLLDEALTATQQDHVNRLQTAAVSLSALVDDILDFSKIEAGEIEIAPAPFAPGRLIEDCLSITAVTAEKKRLELRREIDPALPVALLGDEPRLRQVLLNLLHNAVKFTRQGSVTLRVWQETGPGEARRIRFEVADTGVGIPREKLHRLFHHFSQASASIQHEYGGTGLGLAISRRLVELMGGEIGVESEEARGSTFWFTVELPLAGAVQHEALEEVRTPGLAGGRVLLAEDARQNRDLVRTMLEKQGFRVDAVRDGAEAVAALRSASYDLVLMDIQMPRMDGATATRKIRRMQGPAGTVPILAMTANVLAEQLQSFKRAGINDHIAKPFRQALLIDKIRRCLNAERDRKSAIAAAAAPAPACNRIALDELRELMGEDWVRASLRRLTQRLEETFADPAAAAPEGAPGRERLMRRAHRIVADAGQLGFSELSECFSALEEACAGEGELAPVLARARAAADHAAIEAEGLLAASGAAGASRSA